MDVAIAFLVGIFIGSAAGIFTFARLAAAKMEDEIFLINDALDLTG